MPNRFIDTEFFKRPFVRGLDAPLKTLYAFIICDCDNAGIWSPDFEIASIYIGQKVDKKTSESAFKNKIVELKNGQWFFPDFIEHQYPKGLQETNPAHNKIIKRLIELNLIDKNLKVLPRPSKGSKVEVEVEVKVKEEGIVKGVDFETIWNLYSYKVGKQNAERAWNKLTKPEKETCLIAVPKYVVSTPEIKYRKHLSAYLNGKRWNDEIITTTKPKKEQSAQDRLAAKRGGLNLNP